MRKHTQKDIKIFYIYEFIKIVEKKNTKLFIDTIRMFKHAEFSQLPAYIS